MSIDLKEEISALLELALHEAASGDISGVKYLGEFYPVHKENGCNTFSACAQERFVDEFPRYVRLSLFDVLKHCEMAIEDIVCKSNTCENLKQYINELQS